MSEASDISFPLNIYEEVLDEETAYDLSSHNLEMVPTISNKLLCVLYLQNNKLTALSDDFFPSLPNLMYLDLRENRLTDLPKSIQNHPCLTHLLLQNNNLTSLPNELGTVLHLKVFQLSGNPIMYPPRDVISAGVSKLMAYLHNKYYDNMLIRSQSDIDDTASTSVDCVENNLSQGARSYNSVLDEAKLKNKTLSIQFSEKDLQESDDEDNYTKIKGKCPKLAKCRVKTLNSYNQSSKYLKPLYADKKETQDEKIKCKYLRELATKKHKELLEAQEKILQDRKNIETLKYWRKNYKNKQLLNVNGIYKLEPRTYPYDTSPEYMTLLTREDIEKDLPDKYKKKLIRRSKPTVPRKSPSDVHLAMKIKQLFENLEAINLNREELTPRSEQKVLLNEIQKISEIKQKLMELSSTNIHSVVAD